MDTQKAWYVLHTYSGYENKVMENINMRKESMNMQDNIFRIMVPEEQKIEKREDGTEKVTVTKTFPGYVLIEMIMSDEAWFIVRNTPGVTGFVGSHGAGSKPSPLLEEEIGVILGDIKLPPPAIELDVEVGDRVKITDGAFEGMEGMVEALDENSQTLEVIIEMFGRETVAEIEYSQVEPLNL